MILHDKLGMKHLEDGSAVRYWHHWFPNQIDKIYGQVGSFWWILVCILPILVHFNEAPFTFWNNSKHPCGFVESISHDIHWSTFSPWIAATHWDKFPTFSETHVESLLLHEVSRQSAPLPCSSAVTFADVAGDDICAVASDSIVLGRSLRRAGWILWGQESQRLPLSLNIFNQHLLNDLDGKNSIYS